MAGLASAQNALVLGQPLNFSHQVRLEPGEAVTADCVTAEVMGGDRRIADAGLRTTVEATAGDSLRVRVQSTVRMEEPVVTVALTIGCTTRQTRRFVLLADPPATPPATAPASAAATLPADASATPARTVAQPAPAAAGPLPMQLDQLAPPAAGAASSPRRAVSATAAAAQGTPRSSPPPARGAAPGTREATPTQSRSAVPVRSRLDVVDLPSAGLAAPPSFAGMGLPGANVALADKASLEQAMALVTQATSAAQAAASAASAASERVLALERTVDQLRTDALASRQLASQLRERLAQDDRSARWVFPLLVLVAVLGALAAWLAWRVAHPLRVQRGPGLAPPIEIQARALGRREYGARLATAPLPFAQGGPGAAADKGTPFLQSLPYEAGEASDQGGLRSHAGGSGAGTVGQTLSAQALAQSAHRNGLPGNAARGRPGSTPAWPPPAAPHVWPSSDQMHDPVDEPPEPYALKTQPLSAAHRDTPQAVRDVSIEELIDMEQQAEFFVVLGQDEAAIDLLVDHLRGTGGSSPLPYLKLLEIYHRRGDEVSFERMRARFNHRFNAFAPPWGVDLAHGRDLAEYPGVLSRLAQVWPRPLDAMAELEALLFRKSRGDLFDLPAYREVLFLYALARDLLDRQSADAGNVDLLLPLADGSENSSTSPAPFLMQEGAAMPAGRDAEERPTAPVDFDLSAPAPALSIFDVAGLTQRPASAAFTRAL